MIQVYIGLFCIYNRYIMVGIDDLEGLIQPERCYDSVRHPACYFLASKELYLKQKLLVSQVAFLCLRSVIQFLL